MAYECKFCLKPFVRESSFMKHSCKEMKRADEIRTAEGIGAYEYYCTWMRLSNRKAPPIETFTTSRYYKSFKDFFEKVKKLKLPSPETFIRLMTKGQISPMLWCRDECYSKYLEWIDRTSDPIEQASVSVDTLYKIAETCDTPVTHVFQMVNYREVMQLIRQRQLSPWLLLCSKEFKTFLGGLEESEKDELLNLIGYTYWAEKFESNPAIVQQMKLIAAELGI